MGKKRWMAGMVCAFCTLPLAVQAAEGEMQSYETTAVNVTAQGYEKVSGYIWYVVRNEIVPTPFLPLKGE